ncbi:hypothetical protein CYMTET_49901 [Cymbomonas tetramitiformis]|uniref:Uncharacterized protein n=1 Tax=Cymbomonas tetramitiformis TaxID=36881 RepID=A0AAE0EVC2_9CHLO|nr:hypothetical protein CYMTET_49901 [Cymbomonas tetramitiformis]
MISPSLAEVEPASTPDPTPCIIYARELEEPPIVEHQDVVLAAFTDRDVAHPDQEYPPCQAPQGQSETRLSILMGTRSIANTMPLCGAPLSI